MPSCVTPTQAAPMLATVQAAYAGRAAVRAMPLPGQIFASTFPVFRIELASAKSALAPSASAVPTAHVPLFKAHCSFLI